MYNRSLFQNLSKKNNHFKRFRDPLLATAQPHLWKDGHTSVSVDLRTCHPPQPCARCLLPRNEGFCTGAGVLCAGTRGQERQGQAG